ncbi:MAG TPA: ABC transporter permease, partial [Gammaproteobacteria bacterium]|nr:ABC transporter permease [Gammaproteobacteria bacterium]
MLSYILKRLAQGILTVWFIATATFFAMHNVPGDPLTNDRAMTDITRANLEAKYGLDQPITTQYLIFLRNLSRGDFGISFVQENREVNDIIREHFPVSAILGVLAVIFAATGGVLFGALTALYRNRFPDYL